ncbi:MAG: hypothetical protein QOC60_1146 [Frankiaceae bacterium]|nr:hypothetical protein [Frankiaceae bacterium]
MQVVRWVGFGVGLLLVVGTALSVLRSLIAPRSYSSRLYSAVGKGMLFVFLALVRRRSQYEAKDRLLALVAPFTLAAMLAAWIALFLLGYSLMIWPLAGGGLGEAFRVGGSAMFTLGFIGDGTGPTALLFVAAATGPVIIALQIAYLPTLYGAFNRREVLVTLLESRAGAPAWGPELLARHQLVSTIDNLPAFYAEWEQWAADVAESHATYPVLVWFRSAHELQSWVGGLLAVLDSAAIFLAVAPSRAPSEARLCLRMGFTCLRRVADTVGLAYEHDPLPEDDITLTRFEFDQGVAHIERAGFPVERSAEEAWPHFKGWRVNYEAIAYALADRIVAPPALWSGERRHLPGPPIPPWRPPHREPGKKAEQD